jgi:hypothetical protein
MEDWLRAQSEVVKMFAGLSILASVVIFGAIGCTKEDGGGGGVGRDYKPVKCQKNVTVLLDPQHKHGLDKDDIYVCVDEPQVTWTKGNGVNTFKIVFPGGLARFNHAKSTKTTPPRLLTISRTVP